MENHPQTFDVCVVCALPEEAGAFLEIVRQQCEDALEERSSARYHYSYRFALMKNNKDESLILHISWLPRYGPLEMSLHLSHVLEECQPRIAIMTGICAGDAQRVQLGDLVVAERTFTYDNGKFTLDEHGRRIHEHDTMTYQLDANILQFLGLFDDWKPLVARLSRPPSLSEQRTLACHIKAMASGNAVRTDNPFEDVRAPVRGAVAVDMEGAAFGLVMSRHPLTCWLVVKGVCDYADQDKNDTYHDYTARTSALYALSFIRAYVTNERLPQHGGPSSSSRAGPSGIWNAPNERPEPSSRQPLKFLLLFLLIVFVAGTAGGGFWFWIAHNQASLANTPESTGAIWCDAFLTHNPNEAASVSTSRLKTLIQNGGIPLNENYSTCVVEAVLEHTSAAAIVVLTMDNYERRLNMVYQQGKWLVDLYYTAKIDTYLVSFTHHTWPFSASRNRPFSDTHRSAFPECQRITPTSVM